MRHAAWVGLRGYIQVFPIAVNTYQIAHGYYVGAFVGAFVISLIWWSNAGASGRSKEPMDGPFYALGAALGTVSGIAATRWLYGVPL
jgi:hypothetical protein